MTVKNDHIEALAVLQAERVLGKGKDKASSSIPFKNSIKMKPL